MTKERLIKLLKAMEESKLKCHWATDTDDELKRDLLIEALTIHNLITILSDDAHMEALCKVYGI